MVGLQALEGLKVLLVDDEPGVLKALSLILKAARCEVLPFSSPVEVADYLRKGDHPDVIVSDLRMPGLNGIELLQSVRASGCSTPFVLMSGHASSEDVASAKAESLTAFLGKPFNPQELLSVLSRVCPTHADGTGTYGRK